MDALREALNQLTRRMDELEARVARLEHPSQVAEAAPPAAALRPEPAPASFAEICAISSRQSRVSE